MSETDLRRILAAADTLSESAHHRLAVAEGSTVPCPFPDCVLSAAEHHRLAYGLLADNRDLTRRLRVLENESQLAASTQGPAR
jgi:hypothetical protein